MACCFRRRQFCSLFDSLLFRVYLGLICKESNIYLSCFGLLVVLHCNPPQWDLNRITLI